MSIETLRGLLIASFALTGVALGCVLAFGRKRRIPAHLTSVGAFAVGFAVVLFFAESLGRKLEFEATIERVHLAIAFTATGLLLAPLVTGWRRYRGSGSLRAHRIAVGSFLVLFVAATATGVAMLTTGKPRVEVETK
jgi:hypothetical protein